jgi:pyruvate kinase
VLAYGVHAVLAEDVQSFREMVHKAVRLAHIHGLAGVGQRLVITAGAPFGTPGSTNILRIARVEPPGDWEPLLRVKEAAGAEASRSCPAA